jgi:hypothetical protein
MLTLSSHQYVAARRIIITTTLIVRTTTSVSDHHHHPPTLEIEELGCFVRAGLDAHQGAINRT